jgi:hypothetical protein
MVGAAIRGDDEVGVEVGGGRLDEDVDRGVLALAAAGVADDPAHGIAGGDGDELFAGLQADVGDLIDGGIELIERTAGVGVDLDGIDVTILAGLDTGAALGSGDALLGGKGGRALGALRALWRGGEGFELAGKRQGFGDLDIGDLGLGFGLARCSLEGRAVEEGDFRDLDVRGAGAGGDGKADAEGEGATGGHFGSPEAATSCEQLKACT